MSEKRGFFRSLFGGGAAVKETSEAPKNLLGEEDDQEIIIVEKLTDTPDGDMPRARRPSQPKEHKEPVPEDVVAFCVEQLNMMLTKSLLFGTVKVKRNQNNSVQLDISDSEDLGRIIGKDGATLSAFQVLLRSMILKKFNKPFRVFVDAGDYHHRRIGKSKNAALKAAKEAIETGRDVRLHAMSADERRFVHVMFETHDQVKTASKGSGRDRFVVIQPR